MANAASDDESAEHVSGPMAILRLFWLKLGNAALLILALYIFKHGRGLEPSLDVPYVIVVVLILGARLLDGAASKDAPRPGKADPGFWKFAAVLLGSAGAVWLVAHGFGGLLR